MAKESLSTQPYKGTRDFYPEDMRVRNFIFNRIRKILTQFGYNEYDGPMVEPFELYAAKTSEEIVKDQLYHFTDRGERHLAIRPEMTPTLARMVAARQNELPKPIRWFSIPNLWRYERPQRGRLREHWQLNVDVFGGEANLEDLEICQVIYAIMDGFGANKDGQKRFEVRLNHRGLTNCLFRQILKLEESKIKIVGDLMDRALKIGMDKFKAELAALSIPQNHIDLLVSFYSAEKAALPKEIAEDPSYQHLQKLLSDLNALGIGSHFKYDPSIMRGFMYYTGMVLEVYDLHPDNNRALFGGGRYDNLVGLFGGSKPLPGVGFGMGDVTFTNFLETHGLLPNLNEPTGIFIAHIEKEQILVVQKLAAYLRKEAAKTNIDLPICTALITGKLLKYFQSAEKLGAACVLFVGSSEVESGTYKIKHLASGSEVAVKSDEIIKTYLGFLK